MANPKTFKGLELQIWNRIFVLVSQDRPQDLKEISGTCITFAAISRRGKLWARRWFYVFGSRFALIRMYELAPRTLTQEVAEALIDCGCILPKYWIEGIFTDQGHDPHRLPEGTLELIIAHGFQKYDDALKLVVPFVEACAPEEVIKAQSINGSLDVGDDARAFDACFRTQDIDVDTLEKLIHKHNYMPALCPPNNQEEEQLLWERLATLSQQNPGLAYEISQVCGVPSDITNYYVVSLSLDVTEYSNDSLEALIQSGFCLTTKIGSAFFYRHGADALVEQRRPFLVQKLQKDFQDCIESGLSDLLEEAAPDSLQRADAILTEFKLSEKAVERALRAPETDVESKSTPLLTKCAQAQAGMRDGLWQLLMGLYSPTHRLVSHCVADLVMAGTSKISPESLRGSVLFRRDSETSIAQSLKGSPSFDESLEETESRSRQSLSICIQSGVPLSCETFGLISKWIFQTQQVANRHLDYMIHVEKMILKILHLTSSNLTAHFLDESDKAVLFEWLASFFGNVLNSSDWIATLRIRRKSNQGVSVAEHGRLSFIQQSITDTMNGLMDPIILMSGQLGDLKRFYDAIQVLADRIETVCARPPPGDPGDELNEGRDVNDTGRSDENLDTLDSMESLPFREWLKSRETPPEPRSATVSSRASWISEFISK